MGKERHHGVSEWNHKKTPPPGNKSKPCNMGAYRSRVGNGMLPGENVWHKLVMIRKTGAKEEDS